MTYKNRKSIRLKDYDYSKAGLYFITICANHRQSIFGNIDDDVMILNDAGLMIEKCYFALEDRFRDIKCHDMIVMPNHFHCIIEIVANENNDVVGVPLVGTQNVNGHINNTDKGQPRGIAPTVGDIVGAFKSITTNEYIRGVKNNNWQPFDKKMWQRNYWEHIIRSEESYVKLSEYIISNPQKWEIDTLHPNNVAPKKENASINRTI